MKVRNEKLNNGKKKKTNTAILLNSCGRQKPTQQSFGTAVEDRVSGKLEPAEGGGIAFGACRQHYQPVWVTVVKYRLRPDWT